MKRSRSGSDLPTLHFIEAPNNIDSADYNDRLHSPCSAPSSCPPSAIIISPVLHPAAGAHHSQYDAADQSRPPAFISPAPFSKPPSVCSSSSSSRRGLSSSIPAAIAQSSPKLSSSTTGGGEVLMQGAAAASNANIFGGWPCRSYGCSFCGREFNSAQALGGHMNIHRRDRARLRTSLENLAQPSPALLMSAADNYQSAIFPSPHAAARHSLNDVANLPFSASLVEYYREHPGPRSQLDMNRRGAMFNPLRSPSGASSAAVSPFATDQIPFHHSPQLPIMTLAAAPTQPDATASSFSDLPLQSSVCATNAALNIISTSSTSDSARPRSPSNMSRTCHTLAPSSCTQLRTGTVFPFHIASSERPYCSFDGAGPALSSKQSSDVLRMRPDLNSLQCIASSPNMAQPGLDPSSILDLELRLGQSSSPAGSR